MSQGWNERLRQQAVRSGCLVPCAGEMGSHARKTGGESTRGFDETVLIQTRGKT